MSAAAGARILVIDDERDLREMLELGLSLRGYQVITASGGEVGLRLAREQPVDLVICDIKMPGLDGFATLCCLRQQAPDTPVVIATGLLAADTSARCRQLGAAELIRKPFALADLVEVIERHIRPAGTRGSVGDPASSDPNANG